MKIELKKIKISELCKGYKNDDATGAVVAYDGKLDIRPPYQREFVYDSDKQKAVIKSVFNGFPLNVMYWAVRDDGTYEVMDGQQRTISICQFYYSKFSVKLGTFPEPRNYSNLKDEQSKIDDYELLVYQCSGTYNEKLAWFKTINIAGEKLYEQEIRNAIYSGPWVSDAKSFFSKNQCIAQKLGGDYMSGSPIRQDYLETVISWVASTEKIGIDEYMQNHQNDKDATPLKEYYKKIIEWIEKTFTKKRKKEMCGLPWGLYYNEYKDSKLNPTEIEKEISKLMSDIDVVNKKGIYAYILDRKESHLNIRTFDEHIRRSVYERQKCKCAKCQKECKIEEMDADHIKPWSKGGQTTAENCQMLCRECNRRKSDK